MCNIKKTRIYVSYVVPGLKVATRSFIVGAIGSFLGIVLLLPSIVSAFPDKHWITPSFSDQNDVKTGELIKGGRIEVLRDSVCFDRGRAGERIIRTSATLSQSVESAEVFISGFNMLYPEVAPGETVDSEVMQDK